MKRLMLAVLALLLLAVPAPASAAFELTDAEARSEAEDSTLFVQAGGHPFAFVTQVAVATELDPDSGKVVPVEEAKDLDITFPPGLIGNPSAVSQCPTPVFLAGKNGECSDASAVGYAEVEFGEPGKVVLVPIYNLEPSPGTAAKLGFIVEDRAPVTIDIGLSPDSPNKVEAHATNISQALFFLRAKVIVWGHPTASSHDQQRGHCRLFGGTCPVVDTKAPFLTLPPSCDSPLAFAFEADSWQNPDTWVSTTAAIGEPGPALAPTECDGLEFEPEISTAATTSASSSASGLDFSIDVDDPGLTDASERAQATIEKAVVTLPNGMTLNPSAADGLGTCSPAALAQETFDSPAGAGCPEDSKIGSLEVETPLLEGKLLKGSIYVATPGQNPFGTLIAVYMVIKDPALGILVKLPGEVIPDSATGQLTATFGEAPFPIPQVPFSHFRFHFRSGPRAPLVTPAQCGSRSLTAVFTPSSGGDPLARSADIDTTAGVGGGPCAGSGALPFDPALEAGSANAAAGSFSPFYMRLTRGDGQQTIDHFSAILPPGVTGKIAGVSRCPQASVEAAKTRSGSLERALSSCPEDSRIGSTTSGSGVGSQLTWVPGSIYLGGPYRGAPLSVVAIVPAVAGPFDVGTVVVQEGLDLNPTTGEVEVVGAASDPIPPILAGIPLLVRDLRVNVDRQGFTLNPTDCEPATTRASVFGAGFDLFNPNDNSETSRSARYQASNCASLRFKPKLNLSLKGATNRTGHPSLAAVVKPRMGDANIGATTVSLPRTEFIDNAHISNPCTRVQFAADQCPPGSVLGTARAFTPLLEQPLEGPVYFRSNGGDRKLPDVVADLHGQFRVILVGFVDTRKGRLRTRFLDIPDAPVSKFVLKLKGGKKGLLVNSASLCAKRGLTAKTVLVGQNGRRQAQVQGVGTSCKRKER